MSLYTIILMVFFIFMLLILGGVLLFIMWLDKKIDKQERLGYSAYIKKKRAPKDDRVDE